MATASITSSIINAPCGPPKPLNAVLDTVRMSVCSDLTDEEAKGIAEDYNMEMFKIRTVLDEAMRNHKLGERV